MIERYPFIFSDEKKYRIRRHIAFWFFWWIFQAFLYSLVAVKSAYGYRLRLESSIVESLIYLIPHIFLSYSLMYFVIPRFVLKQKYWTAVVWLTVLAILTAAMSSSLSFTVIDKIRIEIIGSNYLDSPEHISTVILFLGLLAGLRGGITVAGIAASIKLMKYWYIKEQRNLQLQKENLASQLQLLKAQVHPHFLFNTLNNIYSYTQKVSPVASTLIMGLSDMMRYILHEGSKPSVPFSKELKMINDYITLEQVRYGNSLDINKETPADTSNLHIAPLLLLPFVENCFKHGTSGMLDQPWIRMAIQLDGNKMKMTLVNAKFSGAVNKAPVSGIGIINVKKRLELLYPGRHQLTITSEEDVYIVNLSIELESGPVVVVSNRETNELSYA
jgi:sensor histidine kinase YesM